MTGYIFSIIAVLLSSITIALALGILIVKMGLIPGMQMPSVKWPSLKILEGIDEPSQTKIIDTLISEFGTIDRGSIQSSPLSWFEQIDINTDYGDMASPGKVIPFRKKERCEPSKFPSNNSVAIA